MAAESGGNVAGTQAGEKTLVGETLVIGPVNIPSRMPVHASEMYAKNLYNLLNKKDICTGGYEQGRSDLSYPTRFGGKYYYMQGLNCFLNVSYRF